MLRTVHGEEVYGVDIDEATRCAHWHTDLDVIAIKFKCCGKWYPCFECHASIAEHEAAVWPRSEFDESTVLCGRCGRQLTVNEYLECSSTCPNCGGGFNPGCVKHLHLYFQA